MPDVIVNKNGVFIDTHVRYRTISDNLSKQEYKFLLTTTLTISVIKKWPHKMMNLGLKSMFPGLCNTVVKKRALIIEEVHTYTTSSSSLIRFALSNTSCIFADVSVIV